VTDLSTALERRVELLARLARPAGGRPLRVFCSGVGGTGVSGLARLAAGLGHRVVGSDRAASATTEALELLGLEVLPEQRPENLAGGADLFVATAALDPDHPELVAALRQGIPVVKYAEALAAFVAARRGVAIAGTHGKTTTTALTAFVLRACGRDPGFLVGGRPKDLGANASCGADPELVFEACEYDRSFHRYSPSVAVVLNVEVDHLDCYAGLEEITDAFVTFAAGLREGGRLLVAADCPGARRVAELTCALRPDVEVTTFGRADGATLQARDVSAHEGRPAFDLWVDGERVAPVRLRIPGAHHVANALAAIAAAAAAGVDPRAAAAACERFTGVGRRFDVLRPHGDVVVVDDYAHHPTALAAVLAATRARYPDRRLVALFEPHQASRTRQLFSDFATALTAADRVVVCEIYACRDQAEDLAAVSASDLARAVRRVEPRTEASAPGPGVFNAAMDLLQAGDVALFLGAGTISGLAHRVADAIPPTPSSGVRKRVRSGSYPRRRPLERTLAGELGGLVRAQVDVGAHCTFRTGGRARFLVEPTTQAEAVHVLRVLQKHGVPTTPLGGGSNVLFVSDVYDGAVVLTRHLRGLRVLGRTLRAGAGTGLQGAIRAAEQAGLAGLEEFAGIPGTLGGAVFGNAGGPPDGPAVGDLVRRVRVLLPDGRVVWRERRELGYRYRGSDLEGCLVLAVDLDLEPGDPAALRTRRLEQTRRKARVQPLDARSAGCVFRNPPGDSAGRLIDRLGLKELRRGGARVSPLHGNFIVNEADAAPGDILDLVAALRERVRAEAGHDLHTELRLIA